MLLFEQPLIFDFRVLRKDLQRREETEWEIIIMIKIKIYYAGRRCKETLITFQ